jgi:hypothetical protein
VQTRDHGCFDWCAILHTKVLEHVNNGLALGEGNLVCGAVMLNVNAKELVSWS